MIKRRKHPMINAVPMIDFFLILAIIFIAAHAKNAKTLPISLPKTNLPVSQASNQNVIKISLSTSRRLNYNSATISLDAFLQKIDVNSVVEVYSDENVAYADIAWLISSVSARNPRDVRLMVD